MSKGREFVLQNQRKKSSFCHILADFLEGRLSRSKSPPLLLDFFLFWNPYRGSGPRGPRGPAGAPRLRSSRSKSEPPNAENRVDKICFLIKLGNNFSTFFYSGICTEGRAPGAPRLHGKPQIPKIKTWFKPFRSKFKDRNAKFQVGCFGGLKS